MGMRCTVCQHPKVLDINKEILAGQTWTIIANTYGLNFQAVRNHAREHLPKRMVAAFKKKEAMENLNMMDEFTTLLRDIKQQINEFKDKGKDALSIKATDTLIRLYQTMAQFASVYYQSQADENQQQREIEEEAQRDEVFKKLDILSPDEREIFRKISLKVLTNNKKMDCVGEFIKDRDFEKSFAETSSTRRTPPKEHENISDDKEPVKPKEKPSKPKHVVEPTEIPYTRDAPRDSWKHARLNPYK